MSVGRPKKRKFSVPVTINDDYLVQKPVLSNMIRCEIRKPGLLVVSTPIRTAKAKGMAKLSEVIKIPRRVINENAEKRHGWLEDMRKQQLERLKIKMKSKDTVIRRYATPNL